MRLFCFVLLLALCTPAFSWSYGGGLGKNRQGETVGLSDDPPEIWVAKPNAPETKNARRYNIRDECPGLAEWLDVDPEGKKAPIIACRLDGESPLAGATYTKIRSRKIRNACGYPAMLYQCVKGCEKRSVPKRIIEDPWEC